MKYLKMHLLDYHQTSFQLIPQLVLIRLSDLASRSFALPEEFRLSGPTNASLEWNDDAILLRGRSQSALFRLE